MKRTAANMAASAPPRSRSDRSDVGQWLASLDRAGARKLPHRRSPAAGDQAQTPDWWARWWRSATNRPRPAPQAPEPDGFEISVTKTIAAPVDRAFAAWKIPALRENGCPAPRSRCARRRRTNPSAFSGDGTASASTSGQGPAQVQVVPQHAKLPTPESAEQMKPTGPRSSRRCAPTRKVGPRVAAPPARARSARCSPRITGQRSGEVA